MHIVVQHIFPPIPDRRFDWCAVPAEWDLGMPVGFGPTQEAAIADLLELEEFAGDGLCVTVPAGSGKCSTEPSVGK